METKHFNDQLAAIKATVGKEQSDVLCVSGLESMLKELKALPHSREKIEMIRQYQRLLMTQVAYEMNRWLKYHKIQGMN
ncbi:MAG: hypothetical protein CVU54_14685 [Deltaproteobacteria bacterium HGW-Deltaproteobacteria-12]|jgi:hypothetical protein|nr:MAG: hypothetical protein CVU54_14685 [Deltaproteobacteria bacterium HGW-Deltaproteobacteria-12]